MGKVKDCVVHQGVVDHVSGDKVYVNIVSMSACASCHAKGLCNMSEMEEKLIEAVKPQSWTPNPGEQVTLEMEEQLGTKAVLFGYFYPFLVVLFTLIVLTSLGINEGISGLISVGVLVPYYFVLFLMKDRFKKNFAFKIR